MLGPIDYIAVGFEGNKFDGSILAELSKAVESKTIRVVDLLFVTKDSKGNVSATEVEDQTEELRQFTGLLKVDGDEPLLADSDIEKISASMENNTSAGILIIEHLWAKGLKEALVAAGGVLITEGRIHPETVAVVSEELAVA